MNTNQLTPKARAFLGINTTTIKTKDTTSLSLAQYYMTGASYEQMQAQYNLTEQQLKKEIRELFKKDLIHKRDKRKPICSMPIKVEAAAMMIAGATYADAQAFIKDKTGITYALATIKTWKNAPKVQDQLKQITQH